jgi:hypothetical protein
VEVPYGVTLVVPAKKKNDQSTDITFTVKNGATLEVKGNIEVVGKVEVTGTGDSNKGTLDVTAGGKLTVAAGGEVTAAENGKLDVKGKLNLADATSKVVVTGTYRIEGDESPGCNGTNNGTIAIKNGGETIGKGGNIAGTGYTVVEKDAIAYIELGDGTLVPQIASEKVNSANPIIMLAGDTTTLSFNAEGFLLDGNATVHGRPDNNEFLLDEEQGRKLTIKTGVLTIPSGVTLYVDVKSTWPGIVGEAGTKIIIETPTESGRGIVLRDGDGNPDHALGDISKCNFYAHDGSRNGIAVDLPAKTYTWGAVPTKTGTYGWVAGN